MKFASPFPTISTAGIKAILFAAQQMGLAMECLLEDSGLDKVNLEDNEVRLDCQYAARLYIVARDQWLKTLAGESHCKGSHCKESLRKEGHRTEGHRTECEPDNRDFGLHHGKCYQPFTLGIIGQLLINSPTVHAALYSFVNYQKAFGEGVRLELDEQDETVSLSLWVHDSLAEALVETVDSIYTALIHSLSVLSGMTIHPVRLELQRTQPVSITLYQDIFKCPIQFESAHDVLVLRSADLQQPLLMANPSVFQYLEQKTIETINKMESPLSWQLKVKQILCNAFNGEKITLQALCRQLGVSASTLQRKLKRENTHFQALLDEARLDFAVYHLKQSSISIDEVAYLLGYSETSVFRKSFKRWKGMTPAEYKQAVSNSQ